MDITELIIDVFKEKCVAQRHDITISSLYNVIVRGSEDSSEESCYKFDNLSRSHLQSQVNSVNQSMML